MTVHPPPRGRLAASGDVFITMMGKAYNTETNPGTQELRPPGPESIGKGQRVTCKGGLPQSFTASPDVERSFLEFVTELSDNQNFDHGHTFLCVHNPRLYA